MAYFDFSKMPLVLAGPMLRRVTESEVTVWIALSIASTKVQLDVYAASSTPSTTGPPTVVKGPRVFHGEAKTQQVGSNLHVIAVTASKPGATLDWGGLYLYDMAFDVGQSTR